MQNDNLKCKILKIYYFKFCTVIFHFEILILYF